MKTSSSHFFLVLIKWEDLQKLLQNFCATPTYKYGKNRCFCFTLKKQVVIKGTLM